MTEIEATASERAGDNGALLRDIAVGVLDNADILVEELLALDHTQGISQRAKGALGTYDALSFKLRQSLTRPSSTAASDGEAVREALTKARDQFRFYAAEHESKAEDARYNALDDDRDEAARPSLEKAATNKRFADMCDAALSPSQAPTTEREAASNVAGLVERLRANLPNLDGLADHFADCEACAPEDTAPGAVAKDLRALLERLSPSLPHGGERAKVIEEWRCRRCGQDVDMVAFRCGCTTSPSPWEPKHPAPGKVTFKADQLCNECGVPKLIGCEHLATDEASHGRG